MKARKPRKDGGYSVLVSFSEAEENLLRYADTFGNFSAYVKRLIREDMEKNNNSNNSNKQAAANESEIMSLLFNMLKKNMSTANNINTGVTVDIPAEPPKKPKIDLSKVNSFIKK